MATLSKRRLLGIDRSGPQPAATRAGAPLRPLTVPNLVVYARLAAIPAFAYLAFESGDGRAAGAAAIFFLIAAGDYLDGFLARLTGQYSRLGTLLDPVVDRLTVLCGAAVCWHFALLPRWALATLAGREVATLAIARIGLWRGRDVEINWLGRIAVFAVMSSIFWAMVVDWWGVEAIFVAGVTVGVAATLVYLRQGWR